MKKASWIMLVLLLVCACGLFSCQENDGGIDGNKANEENTCTHTFGDWENVKQPTCKEAGEKVRTCSICGENQNEDLPKAEHTPVTDAAVTATCEKTGLTEGSHCSVCNTVLVAQTTVPMVEHTPVIDAAVAATCKQTGLTEGSHCSVCNTVLAAQTTVPVVEHTPVTDAAVAATCKQTGLTEGSHCSVCNKVIVAQTVIPKTEDHTPVTDAAIAASCKNTGLTKGSHCSVCNKVLVAQTTVPKTENHTPVTDAAVPATCEKTGLTEGSHCSICRKVIVEQATVSRLKHVYDQKKITSEYVRTKATASASATYYYSCICGSKGTTYFSYGSPISDGSGWTSCNKTVYGIAQTYFYTKPNATAVCGMCKVGYSFKVVSTNGEWYKVSGSNVYTNCEAYIKCSDVTDNSSMATFVKVPEEYEYAVDASIKNQFKGAYLCNDISGRSASKVGLIQGSGYIIVASVNQAKTWAAVYYFGEDSEGRSYDGSKLYYCSLEDIYVLGLPDNWP